MGRVGAALGPAVAGACGGGGRGGRQGACSTGYGRACCCIAARGRPHTPARPLTTTPASCRAWYGWYRSNWTIAGTGTPCGTACLPAWPSTTYTVCWWRHRWRGLGGCVGAAQADTVGACFAPPVAGEVLYGGASCSCRTLPRHPAHPALPRPAPRLQAWWAGPRCCRSSTLATCGRLRCLWAPPPARRPRVSAPASGARRQGGPVPARVTSRSHR